DRSTAAHRRALPPGAAANGRAHTAAPATADRATASHTAAALRGAIASDAFAACSIRWVGMQFRGPGATGLSLNVNGRDVSVHVPPHRSLLDTLRESLGLTGAKKVCNE